MGIFGGDKAQHSYTYSSLVWQFLATRICESCSEIRWSSPKKDNYLDKNLAILPPSNQARSAPGRRTEWAFFFCWGGCGVERRILPIHVEKTTYIYITLAFYPTWCIFCWLNQFWCIYFYTKFVISHNVLCFWQPLAPTCDERQSFRNGGFLEPLNETRKTRRVVAGIQPKPKG